MSYQDSLFSLEVMQDHSGRCKDYPAPPSTRAECVSGREARGLPPEHSGAERCQCLSCPYNLIGEIGRLRSDADVEHAISNRYKTETWDSCLLDVVGDDQDAGSLWAGKPLSDQLSARLLGISGARFAQVVANAKFRWVDAMELDGLFEFLGEPVREYMRKIVTSSEEEPDEPDE